MGKGGPELASYMEKTLSLKMDAGRHIEGVLRGYDPFLNIVLDQVRGSERLYVFIHNFLPFFDSATGTRNCGPSAHGFGIDCKCSFEFSFMIHRTISPPLSNSVLRFCLLLCIFHYAGIFSYSLVVVSLLMSLSSPGHSRGQHPHHGVPSTRRSVRFFSQMSSMIMRLRPCSFPHCWGGGGAMQ